MPFAKFLYEQAREIWGKSYPPWEEVGPGDKKDWEDYARCVAAYFAP